MEYAIETFSLTKIFTDWWGRAKVYAVEDLNLRVHHNEVFGLLGPNGSGKTTTMKMLLGLLYPTRGKSLCLGGDARDPKISARIGFLPEESYLYRYLNARETLDFYARLFRIPRHVRKMRIEALLDMVGLKAVANRSVGTYSKGMARRIGLAQALINDPDLLILDEPTTGLDPIGTRQIKDLILNLANRGKTIFLCSHLLADVEDVCDRIAILYGGKIQAEGQVRELLQQTGKRQITTGAVSEEALQRMVQIAKEESIECTVSTPMERLESFFIKTVTTAQEQAQPTSGAVSTTKIGEFLLAGAGSESLLDKLVSAETASHVDGQAGEQGDVASAEAPEPDKAVLSALTQAVANDPHDSHESTAEPNNKSAAEIGPLENEQLRHRVLDELTGRAKVQTDRPSSGDAPDAGGSGDA
jgi:ABC-2 type transport system ATP-binding protein